MEKQEQEPPDKKKKSVRTLRREKNKETSEYVVKQGLYKSLWITDDIKEAFLREIDLRVIQASKAAHRAGIMVNLYLLNLFRKAKNPLEIRVSDKLLSNATFVYQLITNNASGDRFIPETREILDKYNTVLTQEPILRKLGDRNSLVKVADTYITTFKTYIEQNFKRNQNKYIKWWCSVNDVKEKDLGKTMSKLRSKINGFETTEFDYTPKMMIMIRNQRILLGLDENGKAGKNWVKKNHERLIIYYHVLSRSIEKRGGKKLLTAPLPAIKRSFLFIDKFVFYGILKSVYKDLEKDDYELCEMKYYYNHFKIDKPLTANQVSQGNHFTGTIETDGIAVCFHYRRPKLPASKNEEIVYDSKVRTIAVDPGRNTIFYGVEELSDGSWKEHTFSRKEYYQKSNITWANKLNKVWLQERKEIYEQLSKTCKKSTTIGKFLEYITVLRENYDDLWRFHTDPKYSLTRFKVYSGKQRFYDTFFKRVLGDSPKKSVVLAYGDAGFAHTAKYEVAAPKTMVEKQARKWFKITKIDEFRTTKLHYETDIELAKVVKRNESGKIRSVRGLLWFRKTNDCSKFINRDLNAAKNILKCFKAGKNRPFGFNRKDELPKPPLKHLLKTKNLVENWKTVKSSPSELLFCFPIVI